MLYLSESSTSFDRFLPLSLIPQSPSAMYSQTFNNPFAVDPSSNAQSRYPDLSGSISPGPPNQFASWSQPSGYPNNQPMYPSQTGSYPNNSYQQQQQQQQQPPQSPIYGGGYGQPQPNYNGMPNPTPIQSTTSGSGFQPSSSFGQQLVYGSSGSYSYLQSTGQPQQQQQPQYNNTATQQLSNPGYVSQFDPYSSIGQGWDGSGQNGQMPPSTGQQGTLFAADAARDNQQQASQRQHPRDVVRTNKVQLESWDAYSWKQVFNALDALKGSWDERRKEIDGHLAQLQLQLKSAWSGMGQFHPAQIQQEISRLEGLRKDADTNYDSVAASLFQMKELQDGYRQSSDVASKRRVREASNAAVQSLPDWPPQTY